MRLKKAGKIEWDIQGWVIIGLIVLFITIGGALILSGKMSSAIDYIKNFARFG